jgi:aminoglycoside 3-N-acetyltransferase
MLTKAQIKEILFSKGLRPGDHLWVHSSLRSVGPIEGGPDALLDALLEICGSEGTLAMPAFNYRRYLPFPHFDARTTPGRTGALTEIFRQRPDTLRSLHPTHSLTAQGKHAREFLADHYKFPAFGIGSPLDRLVQAGAYVLLLGVTHLANSCIHIGEAHAGRKKFYWEEGPLPIVNMLMPDGMVIPHQLDCSASCSMAFNAIEYPMRRKNLITDLTLGDALCFLMKGRDAIDTVVEMINKEPDALLCNRPPCRPCFLTRRYVLDHPVGMSPARR